MRIGNGYEPCSWMVCTQSSPYRCVYRGDGSEDAVGESSPSDSALLMEDMSTAQVDGAIDPDPPGRAVRLSRESLRSGFDLKDPTVTDALECEWDFVHPEAGEANQRSNGSSVRCPWIRAQHSLRLRPRGHHPLRSDPHERWAHGQARNQSGGHDPRQCADHRRCDSDAGHGLQGDGSTCTPAPWQMQTLPIPLAIISWEVNGASIDASENTLSGADFGRGDEVVCIATPTDGDLSGEARAIRRSDDWKYRALRERSPIHARDAPRPRRRNLHLRFCGCDGDVSTHRPSVGL